MRRPSAIPRFTAAVLGLALASAPALAQCPDGTPPPCRTAGRAGTPVPAPNSVAVLYFENASRDTADQYLADGITEEITTSLGRIGRLHVVSPAAVRRAQQSGGDDPVRLARMLGVRNLVEGSVRRAGPQARITARLLGADARTAVWTDAYTRPTADLLALEEEIARQVASGVVGMLLADERQVLARTSTVIPEAHDHVMRGNFQLSRRTAAAIRRALTEYEAATALDSTYALAWARQALGYALLHYWANLPDSSEAASDSVLVKGERAAERALALDSTISDAWAARGYMRLFRDPVGMRGVMAALRHAVALNPNSAEAHHQFGTGYMWMGDPARGRSDLLRALELEPGRLVTFDNLTSEATVGKRYAEALRWSDSAVAVEPAHPYIYRERAIINAMIGDTAAAILNVETFTRLDPGHSSQWQCYILMKVRAGPESRAACESALRTVRHGDDSATVYLGLGDYERAIDAMESALRARRPFLLVFTLNVSWDPVRANPRFQRLLVALRPAPDN
ncbi:MAG: hypothetical protein ACHQU1_08155 [Gemmatimonadales bacterium]